MTARNLRYACTTRATRYRRSATRHRVWSLHFKSPSIDVVRLDDALGQPRSNVGRPKPDELSELAKWSPPLLHKPPHETRTHSQALGDLIRIEERFESD
jgi:hypothetical protein